MVAMDSERGDLVAHGATKTSALTRAGLNLIQQALSIYDGDLRLALCNSRFQEMFGLPERLTTPGALFSDTIRYLAEGGDYGQIDDLDQFTAEKVQQALAFAPHYVERERANGRTISVEGSPLPQGGWVTVYTDITAIKRQEALLRSHSAHLSDQLLAHSEDLARANRELAATIATLEETKRHLTESEALTRTTTEMMPAHIAHIGLDEVYTYSNGQLRSVMPDGPPEIEGEHVSRALGGEIYPIVKPYFDSACQGTPSVFEFSHSEGARRCRVALTPGRDQDGKVSGVYVMSMDITDEAQARAALMQTHKRELAAQLTSGLAHDFANLLTIILGLQGQLEKQPDLGEEARELITTTRAAALRGGVLLDRLSNISGQRNLHPTSTNLAELFRDISAMASPSLPDLTELSLECGTMTRPVILDSGFFQDALLNLILNARDAIGPNGGAIQVRASTLRETWLELSVRDTGRGFSTEALERGLEPFYTTKRNDEGSGLGLSMVYDFAQLSGGLVKLANRAKGGGVVTLRLPLKYGQEPTVPRLVLLVEDSPEIRTNVRKMLRDLGHSVLEASSAEEAEALAEIPEIDTVLTDITLNGTKTGLDLARALRRTGKPSRIFLMTSRGASDSIRRAAAQEFPLLSKPFSGAELTGFLETDRLP